MLGMGVAIYDGERVRATEFAQQQRCILRTHRLAGHSRRVHVFPPVALLMYDCLHNAAMAKSAHATSRQSMNYAADTPSALDISPTSHRCKASMVYAS